MSTDAAADILQRNLKVFTVLAFLRGLIFIVPIWVAYERQFITNAQLVFLEGIILGSQLILELPTGAFADLVGKRLSVSLGLFAVAVSYFVYGFAVSFEMFLLFTLILGFGEALFSGAHEALLYDSLKEAGQEHRFDKENSRLELIFQFSIAAATVTGGFLGSLSLRLPIFLYAGVLVVTALVILRAREPFIDTEKFTLRRYGAQTVSGFRELFKTPYIMQVALFYVLVGAITWTCQLVFNVMVLTDLGYTTRELGFTIAALRITNSVILFRLVRIGTFMHRRNVFLFFPLFMMLVYLPGVFMTKWLAVPLIAGAMFSSTARWSVLSKYTNAEFDSRRRATAISALSMLIGIVYVALVWASGPVIEWWGNTTVIFTLLGLITMVGILPLGIRLSRITRQEG